MNSPLLAFNLSAELESIPSIRIAYDPIAQIADISFDDTWIGSGITAGTGFSCTQYPYAGWICTGGTPYECYQEPHTATYYDTKCDGQP